MDINRNNYMVWISDFYEDTLSDSEKRTLYNFLDLNPDLKEEFEAFDELVLYPDIARRLDKSSLHKSK